MFFTSGIWAPVIYMLSFSAHLDYSCKMVADVWVREFYKIV